MKFRQKEELIAKSETKILVVNAKENVSMKYLATRYDFWWVICTCAFKNGFMAFKYISNLLRTAQCENSELIFENQNKICQIGISPMAKMRSHHHGWIVVGQGRIQSSGSGPCDKNNEKLPRMISRISNHKIETRNRRTLWFWPTDLKFHEI